VDKNTNELHHLDAALARPLESRAIDPSILGIGVPKGIAIAHLGLSVQKSGRSTGVTRNFVTVLDATVDVGFGQGRKARLRGQIITGKMGEPGDSGSLLMDGAKRAVGLLFAGSSQVTLFNPISNVLDALHVKLTANDTPAQKKVLPYQADLRTLCNQKAPDLLSLPNVVGVGIGYKEKDGQNTGKVSLVVLVEKKLTRQRLAPEQLVPPIIEDVPTDVVESGKLEIDCFNFWYGKPQNRLVRLHPARPGISIGHYRVSAGTFGAVVYDRHSDEPLILSNNHVLANATDGKDGLSAMGDPILQPGFRDGGQHPKDQIGTLLRYIPLTFD
jgi:hypothetical protein